MKRFLPALLAVLLHGSAAAAGDYDIRYNSLIKLPADAVEQRQLLSSIDAFLQDMAAENKRSPYVDPDHFAAAGLFFDELQGYAASARYENANFYRSHLLGATPAGEGKYVVQIALIGDPPDAPPVFRMIFRMLAVRSGSRFQFRSLMERNEQEWKRKTVGNIEYVFEGALDKARARQFDEFNTHLAKKLGMVPQKVTYIRCKDPSEALGFLGIDYHISTNGSTRLGFNDGFRFLTGLNEEGYEHDLLHIYFGEKFDGGETYRPFEEGIASFYAGSWGEPYADIVRQLRDYSISHPDLDLRAAYEEKLKIGLHDIRYAINALLVEEIEREHGFEAVVDVLHCGSEGERYFEKLGRYLDIDEASFGDAVVRRLSERD